MSISEPVTSLFKPVVASVGKKSKEISDALAASIAAVDIETGHISDEGLLLKGLVYSIQKGQQKTITTALTAIEKLFGGGLVRGACSMTAADGSVKLVVDDIIESVSNSLNSANQADDEIQSHVIKALVSIAVSKDSAVHGASTLSVIRTCFQVHKDSKSANNQALAQSSLNQVLQTILSRLEIAPEGAEPQLEWFAQGVTRKAIDQASSSDPLCVVCRQPAALTCAVSDFPLCGEACRVLNLKNLSHSGSSSGDAYFKDLLLVFQSLCKLAQKDTIPPGSQSPDARIIKAKRLSLDLILYLLTAPGSESLAKSVAFSRSVRDHLILTLFTNSVTPVQKIFSVALQITVSTFANFRPLTEMGIFVEQVFLSIAESGNAPSDHKEAVLETFLKFLDAETILGLFLNFDCQVDKHNVIEKAVNCLAKLAQDHSQPELRRLAVEALVTILRQVHQWTLAQLPSESEESGDGLSSQGEPVPEVQEMRARKSEFGDAVSLFHKKPKRGIEELIKQGFCGDGSPEAVAHFLLTNSGLAKTAIGEFIGEHSELSLQVLSAFVSLQSLAGLNLVDAMRAFLSTFRLPGEGQKIDRILEKFASKYFEDNPNLFATADCVTR